MNWLINPAVRARSARGSQIPPSVKGRDRKFLGPTNARKIMLIPLTQQTYSIINKSLKLAEERAEKKGKYAPSVAYGSDEYYKCKTGE